MRPSTLAVASALLGTLIGHAAWAGPPFLTDDPEPVEHGHWEFYAATQWSAARHTASGTSPHVEVNYGALPGLQLHVIVPAVLSWTAGSATQYGLGDVELGAKLRFIDQSHWRPQIGIFPLVTVPTGAKERRLGAGVVQALLPLWLQWDFAPWTTYGGSGLRLGPGGAAVVLGWLFQRELSEKVALGAEAYVTLPLRDDEVEVQLDLGAIVNFSELHHLLLSAGPSFGGDTREQAYLAYQLTI
jgi:hypothetical protein